MPELELSRLLAQLAKNTPPVIVLLGEDSYLRDACRKRIIEENVPVAARLWAVNRYSLRDQTLEEILQHAQTVPMLASRQVILIADAERLEKLPEDSREKAVADLTAYLADPAPFTVLVLEAGKLDERMKLTKVLREKAATVRVSMDDVNTSKKIEFAATLAGQMAADSGVSIDPEAAEQLADCLDGALAQIRTEVEKLAVWVGASGTIKIADVQALVVSAKKYSVWQLAELLVSGERSRALLFLDSVLRDGEEPAGIVGALAWMYRKLIEAQELPPQTNKFQAAGRLRMRPDTAELAIRQSRAIPRWRLLAGIEALCGADDTLKSGRAANPRAVMEFLVMGLTATSAAKPRPGTSS
ncbi:MAG: DNA polymerase III subunit delta [Acidipila sp.]|nr:DNA polymerase III subunit delta [Acidipila sp.]